MTALDGEAEGMAWTTATGRFELRVRVGPEGRTRILLGTGA